VPRRDDDIQVAAQVQRAYADALLAGDPHDAELVVRDAVDGGLGEALLDDEVIRPALALVGDLWADGRLSVAEEHLATAISRHVVAILRDLFRLQRERRTHRVLLAAAEGEQHVLGLEMAASLIEHGGYDVRQFGADLPVEDLGLAIEIHEPAVVGFTTATERTALNLPAAFAAVRERSPHMGILVGGRGVDEAWATAWDVVVCRHVADAVDRVDALVRRAAHN
jgi:MerR family transcriptional regulator, light-induced transcriptional regulator